MTLLVSLLVDDAANAIGDPNRQRVRNVQWTSFYNRSIRELSQKANVCKYEATFNLTVQAEYRYPLEMTRFAGVEVTDTPTDDDTWRILKEFFRDEFRAHTDGFYPNDTLPTHYFADANGFFLYPRPTAAISNAGLMHYFGLPDRVTDITTATFQLDELAQDYVIRRMVVYADRARNRLVEADSELKQWYTDVESLQDSLDDRSIDRPQVLVPRTRRYTGMN